MASVTANKIYYIGPRMAIQFEKYQNLTSGQPSFLQVNVVYIGFFKNGPTPASFRLFSVFSNKHYNSLPCHPRATDKKVLQLLVWVIPASFTDKMAARLG